MTVQSPSWDQFMVPIIVEALLFKEKSPKYIRRWCIDQHKDSGGEQKAFKECLPLYNLDRGYTTVDLLKEMKIYCNRCVKLAFIFLMCNIYMYKNECLSVCSLCMAEPIELKLNIVIAHAPMCAPVEF